MAPTQTTRIKKWLEAFAKHGTVTHACKTIRIARSTAYDWRKADTAFAQSWDDIETACVEIMERSVYVRGLAGDNLAAIFWLKGARPEKYKDRYEASTGEITNEQLDARIADLARKKGVGLFTQRAGEARPGGEAQGNGNGAAKLA